MEDDKIEQGMYQSVSHWGMIDSTIMDGVVRISCDADGNELRQSFEHMDFVMPLVVVEYDGLGLLTIMGDHRTGDVRERLWFPQSEGALPPNDQFNVGVPANVTRH